MNGFTVQTEQLARDVHIVSVAGELDMHTAPPFEEQVIAAVDQGADRLVIDLSGCEFLDSTALWILVNVNERLDGQRDRLVLVTDDRNIVKVFEITGLDRTFTIVPTLASALNGATP